MSIDVNETSPILSRLWKKLGLQAWLIFVLIFLGLSALRIYGYFGEEEFNSFPVMLSFILMWPLPFLFLNREGRQRIGLSRGASFGDLGKGALLGALAAVATFAIGYLIFERSDRNWFVNIGNTFLSDERVLQLPLHFRFLMFTIPAMLFSPIGEEFLFRGLIQESFAEKWGAGFGVAASAFLFAAVHLAHHGFILVEGAWVFDWLSGMLWLGLMILTSVLFSYLRLKTGSIWTAVISHAFFNLAMNGTIFFILFSR